MAKEYREAREETQQSQHLPLAGKHEEEQLEEVTVQGQQEA